MPKTHTTEFWPRLVNVVSQINCQTMSASDGISLRFVLGPHSCLFFLRPLSGEAQ